MLFLCYPKCTTCQKAKKWLDDNNISYEMRHIVESNPNKEELKKWYNMSGVSLNKFFNTRGLKYKALKLKYTIPNMTEDNLLEVLSSDGMLIKRPLLIDNNTVLIGFKEEQWKELLIK